MSVIFLLIPLSIILALTFLVAFIWAVRSGQYEDTVTPSLRVLLQDSHVPSRSESVAELVQAPRSDPASPVSR